VKQRNDLAAGTYLVAGSRLRMDTALTAAAGHLTLDTTCA